MYQEHVYPGLKNNYEMRLRKKKNDIFIHCIKKNNLYNMSAENNKNILFWLNDAYLVSKIFIP